MHRYTDPQYIIGGRFHPAVTALAHRQPANAIKKIAENELDEFSTSSLTLLLIHKETVS